MEQVNKIALSNNNDKRLQTFDKVTAFPSGTLAVKICESQMKMKVKINNKIDTK